MLKKKPADGIAGSAAFMSHYQCLYIHNKTCRTITLKDTLPAVFNAVFFYMLHATCFPLGTGVFQSKLEICISLSVGLDICCTVQQSVCIDPRTAETTADLNLISSQGENL